MTPREAKNFIVNNTHQWETFNSSELGLLNNEDRLVRRLRDIREHEFYAVAFYLKEYADPKNADKSAVVVGPMVDSQEVAGTWRHVSCQMVRTDAQGRENAQGKHFSLVQELRRGFLTSLDYGEARLVSDKLNPGDVDVNAAGEKFFVLQWNAVDPDLIDSLVEGKISISDQTAVKYRRAIVGVGEAATVDVDATGFILKMLNIGTEMSEDGTGVVRIMFGDTDYVLTGQMSYFGSKQTGVTYFYNVPEALAQGVLNAQLARGVDAVPTGYDHQLGLVNIRVSALNLTGVALNGVKIAENCDETVTADFLWGTGNSALLPIPGSIPAGVSYDRSLTENGDGSFNIVLRKSTRNYRDIPAYDASEDSSAEVSRKEWKGVTTQDLAAALVTDVTERVVRVQKNFREDCSVDIVRDITAPKFLTTGWVTFDHPYGTAGVYAAVNASDTNLTTIKGELTTQANAGKMTSLNPRKNEFDLWDVTASYTPRSAGAARVSSTDWNNFGVEVDLYPSVTDQYGTEHRQSKVFRIMTSSQVTCQSFWAGNVEYTVDPSPDGWVLFPSYRGLQSVSPQYLGDGRWTAHRVMVDYS